MFFYSGPRMCFFIAGLECVFLLAGLDCVDPQQQRQHSRFRPVCLHHKAAENQRQKKKNSSRRAQPPRRGPGKMADGSASASLPSVSPHHQYHRDAIKSSGAPSRFPPVSSRRRCFVIASNTRRARAAAVAEALTYLNHPELALRFCCSRNEER